MCIGVTSCVLLCCHGNYMILPQAIRELLTNLRESDNIQFILDM